MIYLIIYVLHLLTGTYFPLVNPALPHGALTQRWVQKNQKTRIF